MDVRLIYLADTAMETSFTKLTTQKSTFYTLSCSVSHVKTTRIDAKIRTQDSAHYVPLSHGTKYAD